MVALANCPGSITPTEDRRRELFSKGSLTIEAAVGFFGISKPQLYKWMASGRLPYSRNGTRRLLPRLAIEELLAADLTTGPSSPPRSILEASRGM